MCGGVGWWVGGWGWVEVGVELRLRACLLAEDGEAADRVRGVVRVLGRVALCDSPQQRGGHDTQSERGETRAKHKRENDG